MSPQFDDTNPAIANIRNSYFSFTGKVKRIPYLFYTLGILLLGSFSGVAFILFANESMHSHYYSVWYVIPVISAIFFGLLTLIFIWMLISFTVRRLNDVMLDIRLTWLLIVPGVNILFLLVLFTLKGIEQNIEVIYEKDNL